MHITTDQIILFEAGPIHLNATLIYTWLIMALLVVGSWRATRNLTSDVPVSRWQHFLEVVVGGIRDQLNQTCHGHFGPYLPFIGTLFLFILLANVLAFIPGYHPPTGSLSTTAALAVCVFVAVPAYGVANKGLVQYLKHYIEPTPLMLPFHIIGEISKTISLAVRLYGNMMAGSMIIAILLIITPLVVPVVMEALELLIGGIQAYIFSILSTVYIASAAQTHEEMETSQSNSSNRKE